LKFSILTALIYKQAEIHNLEEYNEF